MEADDSAPSIVRVVGLVAGPIAGAAVTALTYSALSEAGAITVGLLTWMAVWWLTLAVDLAVTALLPVLLLPLLGAGDFKTNASWYANDIIFLFGAGFVIAAALERYGLSGKFARIVMRLAGTRASVVVGALMLATATISAFVSNTATAAMMLPVALSLGQAARDATDEARRRFMAAATLGVAYAASIGGVITLIGSPPNAIAASWIEAETTRPLSFAGWMGYGLPVGLLLLPIAWFVLVRVAFPIGGVRLAHALATPALDAKGAFDAGSGRVLVIFLLTVLAWLTRPWWGSDLPLAVDSAIAIAGALLMMTIPRTMRPYRPLLAWRDLRGIPWGVLILFGGGLSIAGAIDRTGVGVALADALAPIATWPIVLVVVVLVAVTCFASELASNTALTATVMPLVVVVAKSTDSPFAPLAVAAALGASLAFMLPVGTPPNAMAFATGRVRSPEMMRAGLLLNVAAIVVISAVVALRM